MTLVSQQRAILFADVTGSTALYERLGDKPAAKAIEACLGQVREAVQACGGRVVKNIGDEVMAVFANAAKACEAARAMQNRVSVMPPVGGSKLHIRVGFHYGTVLEEREDFWGDGVNVAARLSGLAKAGQIYTSAATIHALPQEARQMTRDLSALALKGKQDEVQVFQVLWDDSEEEDATQLSHPTPAAAAATLQLSLAGAAIAFPDERGELSIGRDKECDAVVAERTASRRHARIERRGAQFFVVDESTNGTWLAIDGDKEVLLRRERALLRGRGRISFGTAPGTATDVLSFDCG